MNIKELLAKVTAGEVLNDEEKAFLEAYQEPDVDKAANDRAARARKEADGRVKTLSDEKTELEEQLAAMQVKIDEIEGKEQSELEKLTVKLEKLQKDLEAEKATRATAEQTNQSLVRDHQLDQVFGSIELIDNVDRADIRALFGLRMKEVDLEDEEATTTAIDAFKAKHPALIFVPQAGGSGSGGGTGGTGKGGKPVKIDSAAVLDTALTGDMKSAEEAVNAANKAAQAGANIV